MNLSDAAVRRLREATDAPDLTGTKYEIVERLGQGGMGTVYRAYDRELAREVALKVVRLPESSPDTASRLMREARTLARLEHPGIVPVHDVGTLPDGRVFYAMKLVRGSPLDALPAGDLTDRLRIVERICEAIGFAHAHGVIHRDLKPQNVMVGPFGEVLVMDWGVAKLRGDSATLGGAAPSTIRPDAPTTGDGVVLGTPGYMSPEQASGDSAPIDGRSDVFAIGAILRDLCKGASDDSTSIPRPLQAIITRAMAPEPAARYASVDALAGDVAAFRAAEPVSAYRESVAERARRLARRHSTPILLVVAYLIMRLTFLVVFRR